MTYTPTGDIAEINDSVGGTIAFTFDDSPAPTTITDTRGGVQIATVEASGDLTQRDQNGESARRPGTAAAPSATARCRAAGSSIANSTLPTT